LHKERLVDKALTKLSETEGGGGAEATDGGGGHPEPWMANVAGTPP